MKASLPRFLLILSLMTLALSAYAQEDKQAPLSAFNVFQKAVGVWRGKLQDIDGGSTIATSRILFKFDNKMEGSRLRLGLYMGNGNEKGLIRWSHMGVVYVQQNSPDDAYVIDYDFDPDRDERPIKVIKNKKDLSIFIPTYRDDDQENQIQFKFYLNDDLSLDYFDTFFLLLGQTIAQRGEFSRITQAVTEDTTFNQLFE